MKLQKLAKLAMIAIGVVLLGYGVLLLTGLPNITLGKFSSGSADTNGAVLISLIGGALALYGWFIPTVMSTSGGSSADEP
jgi:uncharacterized RDD family membrane protein YckC